MLVDSLIPDLEKPPTLVMKADGPSVLIVRVGSDKRPATYQDLEDVECTLSAAFGDSMPDLRIAITHHDVDFQLVTG